MTLSITDEYFQLTTTYKEKYGTRTIVLLQVGAFFEVYGLKNQQKQTITHSQIEEFAQICQLAISEKNVCVGNDQIVMAGFRDYTLEKYIQKLTDNDYTAVVYVQEKDGKAVSRKLHTVYSAGTYLSYDTDSSQQITNNIMCVWIEKYQSLTKNASLVFGVAVANIFTGKSEIFEYQAPYYMNPTTFDELERCISTYSPSEILINSTTLTEKIVNTIIQYIGIKKSTIHLSCMDTESIPETIHRCSQQQYIHHILKTFFGEESINICNEFTNNIIATQSYCYLLHFIQEHNPDLVRKIELPYFYASSQMMLLGNHTLKQLNIINDSSLDVKTQYSSVLQFLNKCSSPMGKRLFERQLVHPTFDTTWLTKQYDIIEFMTLPENTELLDTLRIKLSTIRDIEKIGRQIVLKKVYPASISHLFSSIMQICDIHSHFQQIPAIAHYLGNEYQDIVKIASEMIDTVNSHLMIDRCKSVQSVHNFEETIIQKGVSPSLDVLLNNYEENRKCFDEIHAYFNKVMRIKQNDETEYVKIHATDKSGVSLQITKKRATLLKTALTNLTNKKIQLSNGIFFSADDVRFANASSTMCEIQLHCLDNICKTLLYSGEKINREIAKAFNEFLTTFENMHLKNIEKCVRYIAIMDVLHCKSYIAVAHNYCKPKIIEHTESNVDAKQLRHVLIEHIQTNEIYVANDIYLNNEQSGILLYGTNAVGKTSLIRALGIAVIMAQAGMYVPCSQFEYSPYKSIFSRILGNDNLFKGLSTFAVEMSELRMILRTADEHSLVLGDELCSGTETESALSIFMAGLLDLHEKRSSFVFATHFHEIIRFEEMNTMTQMSLKHMAVHYDRERDCLVYDRVLRDGPGNRMYGLEVCKSLYLPEEFLTKAMEIRTKYFPETRGELANEKSPYNAKKIRGQCELCKKTIGEEIHHLSPQKGANDKGFIGTVHKNHPANLMSLCEACHKNIHITQTSKPQKRTKTTKGYVITTA
jgi:DNA mismatch repair protein MutS